MARKIPAKVILEYRALGLSRNLIAKTKKVGRSSVSDVFKRADDLGISYTDLEALSEVEVYQSYSLNVINQRPSMMCRSTRISTRN